MKVHELSKKTGIPCAEILQENPSLKSHMSNVPNETLSEYGIAEKEEEGATEPVTETVDSAETVVEEVKPKPSKALKLPAGVTPESVWYACNSIGDRHELWKYKDLAKKPEK